MGTVQVGVTSLPQRVLDDTKRKFLLIRQQLIQTPSHQIFDTTIEPAHTNGYASAIFPSVFPADCMWALWII